MAGIRSNRSERLRYFKIHKPFGVLSQFSAHIEGHTHLGDIFDVPRDVYPIGRLDKDSEGLLLLTNDSSINKQLLDPEQGHQRTYHVQVEGIPDQDAIRQLQKGVNFRVKKKEFRSKPAQAQLLQSDPGYPERVPPVRKRKSIPTSWIELTLTEGKNRQVRRMCAAVGFPVLRLVRVSIGVIELGELASGGIEEMPGF